LNHAKEDQVTVMSGPMFYPEAQSALYSFIDGMNSLYESLEIYSKGGAKLLAKNRKRGLGVQWAEIGKMQSALTAQVQGLSQASPKPLTVNEDTIKKQLKMVAAAQK
jgi:hypothetical protein